MREPLRSTEVCLYKVSSGYGAPNDFNKGGAFLNGNQE